MAGLNRLSRLDRRRIARREELNVAVSCDLGSRVSFRVLFPRWDSVHLCGGIYRSHLVKRVSFCDVVGKNMFMPKNCVAHSDSWLARFRVHLALNYHNQVGETYNGTDVRAILAL